MGRYNYHQSAFKNGMISPKLLGRSDIEEYAYSAQELKNMLPAPMGGVFSRPGTVFQQFIDDRGCVIPWETSSGLFYIVYSQKTYTTFGESFKIYDSNWVPIFCDLSETQLLNRDGSSTGLLTHKALTLFQTSSGVAFQELDYNGFSFVSVGNSLVLTHNSGTIPVLTFFFYSSSVVYVENFQFTGQLPTSDTSGLGSYNSNVDMAFGYLSTPYLVNKDNTHLLPSVATTPGAFTSTYVTGTLSAFEGNTATTKNYFKVGMINTFFVLNQGNKEGIYLITSLASGSVANVIVICYGLDTTTKSRNFRRQLFAPDLGFPKIVSSFNNRLVFGNTATSPNWFWGSATNNYRELIAFRPYQFVALLPILETDSFAYPVTSKGYSEIRWIAFQRELLIGTGKEEFVVEDPSPLGIQISSQSTIGGSFVTPIKNSEAVFFVSSDGKSIRQVQYNFDVNGYRSKNISILNDDLIYKLREGQSVDSTADVRIVKMAWQESSRILWVLTSSDNICAVTIEPNSSTIAWSYHEIGGLVKAVDLFTFFSSSIERSVVGIVVERQSGYHIEFMAPEYLHRSLAVDSLNIGDQPIFSDGSLIISTTGTVLNIPSVIPSTLGGLLVPPTLTPEVWLGNAQRFPTGKKFVIASVDVPDATLFVGAHVYLMNSYSGYGLPMFYIATSLENALNGVAYTPASDKLLSLDDAEPTAKYTKWGTFVHHIGSTVDVLGDGVLYENIVIDADGYINLPVAVSRIVAGFRFEGILKTITPDENGVFGSATGSMKRVDRAFVRYNNSRAGSIGASESNMEPIVFPELPYTGTISHTIDSSTDREWSLIIKKDKSLPLAVMSVTLRGKTDE